MSARRLVLVLPLAVAMLSCKDGTGSGAGELEVRVTGPVLPRAVLLEVVGAQQGISVPSGSGWQIEVSPRNGDTVHVLVVAPAGATLGPVVARVQVENVGAVGQYSATILQASATDYTLIPPGTLAVAVLH